MIIPVRCFTCGKVLADKWNHYQKEIQKTNTEDSVLNVNAKTMQQCKAKQCNAMQSKSNAKQSNAK